MLKTISRWTARRAGGRITIYGTDAETGQEVRIVGVDKIEAASIAGEPNNLIAPIATDKDGVKYRLTGRG